MDEKQLPFEAEKYLKILRFPVERVNNTFACDLIEQYILFFSCFARNDWTNFRLYLQNSNLI